MENVPVPPEPKYPSDPRAILNVDYKFLEGFINKIKDFPLLELECFLYFYSSIHQNDPRVETSIRICEKMKIYYPLKTIVRFMHSREAK